MDSPITNPIIKALESRGFPWFVFRSLLVALIYRQVLPILLQNIFQMCLFLSLSTPTALAQNTIIHQLQQPLLWSFSFHFFFSLYEGLIVLFSSSNFLVLLHSLSLIQVLFNNLVQIMCPFEKLLLGSHSSFFFF